MGTGESFAKQPMNRWSALTASSLHESATVDGEIVLFAAGGFGYTIAEQLILTFNQENHVPSTIKQKSRTNSVTL